MNKALICLFCQANLFLDPEYKTQSLICLNCTCALNGYCNYSVEFLNSIPVIEWDSLNLNKLNAIYIVVKIQEIYYSLSYNINQIKIENLNSKKILLLDNKSSEIFRQFVFSYNENDVINSCSKFIERYVNLQAYQ